MSKRHKIEYYNTTCKWYIKSNLITTCLKNKYSLTCQYPKVLNRYNHNRR